MKFETLAIGDELLTGKIADTNSQFVASQLFGLGIVLSRQTVIADDTQETINHVKEAASRAQYVFCFGGLGPTTDDKTVDAISEMLCCAAIEHPASFAKLEKRYLSAKRSITSDSRRQVRYPEKSEPIPNPIGLAPAFLITVSGCKVFFLPGVPDEMKAIVEQSILPLIKSEVSKSSSQIHSRLFKIVGIPESELQTAVRPVEDQLPKDFWLGFRTHPPENHLILYWKGKGDSNANEYSERLTKILDKWLFTTSDENIEATLVRTLKKKSQTLSLAESCTGGLIAHRLSNIPGASEVFWGSATVYQRGAKSKLLNVEVNLDSELVSAECTRKLSENMKQLSKTDWACAITGYMGPDGGTDGNPLGTIYICIRGPKDFESRLSLPRHWSRELKKNAAATYVMFYLLKLLEES